MDDQERMEGVEEELIEGFTRGMGRAQLFKVGENPFSRRFIAQTDSLSLPIDFYYRSGY